MKNMNMTYTAVFIDTVSIQQYVFGSNKLRENIGASWIIDDQVYRKLIPDILSNVTGEIHRADEWEDKAFAMDAESAYTAEIGYIGGGNAMILFREKLTAEHFLREYSLNLLLKFPGLRVAFGMEEVTREELEKDFGAFRKRIEASLHACRNQGYAQTLLPKDGIMDDCPQSNEASDVQVAAEDWISRGTYVRMEAAEDAQSEIRMKWPGFQNRKFTFTQDLEYLGQPSEKGYIAVVHIDGNGIGKQFQACKSLNTVRILSKKVSTAAKDAMNQVIDELTQLFAENGLLADEYNLHVEKDRHGENHVLPVRPLLIGGDDVVFVCEGRLAIHITERYIRNFCRILQIPQKEGENAPAVAACAGIAIVKTHYPFFKAYTLAEQLMRKAKESSREKNDSWISFLVSSSGFSGDLDSVLEEQYKVGSTQLYGGPYSLTGRERSLNQLLEGVRHFRNSWPKNKVMELRDVLTLPQDEQEYFMETLEARKLELPLKHSRLKQDHFGLYMDMIELLHFYPQSLNA